MQVEDFEIPRFIFEGALSPKYKSWNLEVFYVHCGFVQFPMIAM